MSLGWRHADFAARIGEQVTLHAVDGPATGGDVLATLAACSDAVRSGDLVSYSVTFMAGPGAPREQALFLVAASGRDPEPVFLVPLREVGDRLEYEAVFNQSVDNGSSP
jgi:hypothetical protein